MKKLTINGTPYTIPTEPGELTVRDFTQLATWATSDEDTAMLVARLASMTYADAVDSAQIWNGAINLAGMAELMRNVHAMEAPEAVQVMGKACKVEDFQLLNLGQRIALLDVVKQINGDDMAYLKAVPRMLAICVGPQVYGEGWAGYLDALDTDIWEMKAKEAIPATAFFLPVWKGTKQNGVRYISRLTLTIIKRKMARWFRSAFGLW